MKIKATLYIIIILITIFAFASCTDKCKCDFEDSILIENDAAIELFDSINLWAKFGMPKLTSNNYNSYRLSIIPSYSWDKRVFTLNLNPNSPYITVHYFNKYENQQLTDTLGRNETYKLDNEKIDRFETLILNNCFWTMKSDDEPTLDGVGWILEGYKVKANNCSNRNFQVVWRNGLDKDFESLCNEILILANTSYSEQEKINYKSWDER